MVYKRYAKKNGKVYGPYYYESYREDGTVKKLYIGQKDSHAPVVPHSRSSLLALLSIAVVVLIAALAFMVLTPTGKVTLQTQPNYALNEQLGGEATVSIQQGDSIQKDTQIKLSLIKGSTVLEESTKTFEEFLGNQISYVPVSGETVCVNVSVPIVEEVCTDETVPGVTSAVCHDEESVNENNETVTQQVCVNETSPDSVTRVCTNETTGSSEVENCTTTAEDYYYQTPGDYSVDVSDLIDYTFTKAGNYALMIEISSLGVSDEQPFKVSAPEIVVQNTTENVTNKTEVPLGIESSISGIILNTTNPDTNDTDQNVTLTISSVTGPGASATKNITNWYVNNKSIALLNLPFDGGSNSTWARDYSGFGKSVGVYGSFWNSTGGHDGRGAYTSDGVYDVIWGNVQNPGYTYSVWFKYNHTSGFASKSGKSCILDAGSAEICIGKEGNLEASVSGGASSWGGVGRPGTESAISALVVWNGALYAAGSTNGGVYRYTGSGWSSIGTPSAITYSLVVWNNALYAGSALSQVYRYDGGTSWTGLGTLGSGLNPRNVQSLAVYNGSLYAGFGQGFDGTAGVWRYNGGTSWTDVGNLTSQSRVPSMAIYNGNLYAGGTNSVDGGADVLRYDGGTTWTAVSAFPYPNGIYALQVWDGYLFAATSGGTWSYSYRYDGSSWTNVNLNGGGYSLVTWNGTLYSGTGYRYNVATNSWTTTSIPSGANSLAVWNGSLFGGTSSTGQVYKYGNGIGFYGSGVDSNWKHAVLTVNSSSVKMYLNGVLSASAATPSGLYDSLGSYGMLIGSRWGGSVDGVNGESFNGTIDDVMIFNRSLSAEEVAVLYQNNGNLIVAQETSVGDVWGACATPNNGTTDGGTVCGNNVTILGEGVNVAPNLTYVMVNSSLGTNLTTENLLCWVNASDVDGDNITYSGEWYKNGSAFVGEYWSQRTNFSGTDYAKGVAVDSSGNVYVVGFDYIASNYNYMAVKYSSSGSVIWNKTYDGGGSDQANAIAVDNSSNVYVTGASNNGTVNHYYTIKYNSTGDQIWNATYKGASVDEAYGIAVDSSGNVYVTGVSFGATSNYYTIKYNSTGSAVWNASFDSGYLDRSNAVAVDGSGNVYVTGTTRAGGTDYNYYTIKYNSTGGYVWNATYDGNSGTDVDEAYGIAVDNSGNVYVTGGSIVASSYAYYTVKYNSTGSAVWNAVYNTGSSENARDVVVDSVNNVYVTGDAGSDYYTIKYNSTGDQLWSKSYAGAGTDSANGIAVDVSGNVYVTGLSDSYASGDYDFYTLKYKNGFVSNQSNPSTLVLADVLSDQFTSTGENWSCRVQAFDGAAYSDYMDSGNLTILGGPVTDCGIISADTSLGSNVFSNGTCFTVNANDITLDCAGYTITYGMNGTNNSYGVDMNQKRNVTVKNCIIQKTNASGNYGIGISAYNSTNVTLLNNTISTNGQTNNYGIAFIGTANSSVLNNTIGTNGTFANDGIYVGSISGTTSLVSYSNSWGQWYNSQCIVQPGVSSCSVCDPSSNVHCTWYAGLNHKGDWGCHVINKQFDTTATLLNFTIPRAVNFGVIEVSGGEVFYCTLNGHNVFFTGTDNNCGLQVYYQIPAAYFNDTAENILTCTSSGSGKERFSGIRLLSFSYNIRMGFSTGNLIDGNRINSNGSFVNGSVSHGIVLDDASDSNMISNNNITASGVYSDAIYAFNVQGNIFKNNDNHYSRSGIRLSGSLPNIIDSSTLDGINPLYISEPNGDIGYSQTISVASSTNLSQVIGVSLNSTFVNSTNTLGNAFNKSAQLIIKGLPFYGAASLVDLNDVSSFAACGSPRCMKVNYSYGSGLFVFNVSSFTTYAAQEASVCAEFDNNGTYLLRNDVYADGDCFSITEENVTLDCNGFRIIGNGQGMGIFVNATINSTIQNCYIANFSQGIMELSSSNGLINNVTVSRTNVSINWSSVSGSTISNVFMTNDTRTGGTPNINVQPYGAFLYNSDNNNLTNITVRFNSTYVDNNLVSNGIALVGSDNNILTNLKIFNVSSEFTGGGGLVITSTSSNNTVSNSVFGKMPATGYVANGVWITTTAGGGNKLYNISTPSDIWQQQWITLMRIDGNDVEIANISYVNDYYTIGTTANPRRIIIHDSYLGPWFGNGGIFTMSGGTGFQDSIFYNIRAGESGSPTYPAIQLWHNDTVYNSTFTTYPTTIAKAVRFDGENSTLLNSTFYNLPTGVNAVYLGGSNPRYNTVAGNTFYNSSSYGLVYLSGAGSFWLIENNTFENITGSANYGAITLGVPNMTVRTNSFRNITTGAVIYLAANARATKIVNNTMINVTGTATSNKLLDAVGVYIAVVGENRIENNTMINVKNAGVSQTADVTSAGSMGPNVFYGNKIYNTQNGIFLSNSGHTSSFGFTADSNLFVNASNAFRIEGGLSATLVNNVIINGSAGINISDSGWGCCYASPYSHNFTNNTFVGTSYAVYQRLFGSNPADWAATGNIISGNLFVNSTNGIDFMRANGTRIINNNFIGPSVPIGINAINSTNGIILNNTLNATVGILLTTNSINNNVSSNIINSVSANAKGIVVNSSGNDNRLVNNFVSLTGANTTAMEIAFSNNTLVYNNSISAFSLYSLSLVNSLGTTINNSNLPLGVGSMFVNETNGTVMFSQALTFSNATNLAQVMNISFNRTFVNSSSVALGGNQLNATAQITMFGINASDPRAYVDFADSGSFAQCNSPQCKVVNYNRTTGRFAFNVSSFTTYQVRENSGCTDVGASLVMTGNLSCVNINDNNITLDCAGYYILYNADGANYTSGIVAANVNNITIKNCKIIDVNNLGKYVSAINFTRVNLGLIVNNTIVANGTTRNQDIQLDNSTFITVVNNSLSLYINHVETYDNSDVILSYWNSDNNTYANNNISVYATTFNHGINSASNQTIVGNVINLLVGADNIAIGVGIAGSVKNNNITIIGAGTNTGIEAGTSSGIYGTSVNGNNVTINGMDSNQGINLGKYSSAENNTVYINGTSTNTALVFASSFGSANGNVLIVNGSQDTNVGIDAMSYGDLVVRNNNITLIGTDWQEGIAMYSWGIPVKSNLTVSGNRVNVLSSGTDNYGIDLDYCSGNSTFVSNIVNVTGTSNLYGIYAGSNAFGGNFTSNKLYSDGYAIYMDSSSSSHSFTNTLLGNPANWIYAGTGSAANFTATNFTQPNGGIFFPGTFAISGLLDVTKTQLNTTFNNSYLNSSYLAPLNTSAVITLYGISGFTNPMPYVDFAGFGSFVQCNSPQCAVLGYSGGTFVFSVSSFTSYRAREQTFNNPPSMVSALLNSTFGTNLTTENLTCWVNASDSDSSSLNYTGFWYRNGLPIMFSGWNTTFGGVYNDFGRAVTLDSQGNVIITGSIDYGGSGNGDIFVVKYYPNGTKIWNTSIGGINGEDGRAVAVDRQDNIVVTGSTQSFGVSGINIFTVKYNSTGGYIWNRTIGAANTENGYGIETDSQDNVIVVGEQENPVLGGNYKVWIIKYNSTGSQIWNRTVGGGGSSISAGQDVVVDGSDNIIVAGYTDSGFVNNQVWLLKYNSTGSQVWNKTSGTSSTSANLGYGVALDNQGNIVVAGDTDVAGTYDFWTIKYNSTGTPLWNKTIGGALDVDIANDVAVDSSGNIFVEGYTNSFGAGNADFWTVAYNSSGTQLWNKTAGGTSSDSGKGIAVSGSGNIFVTGYTASSGAGGNDAWTFDYEPFGFSKLNQAPGVLVGAGVLDSSLTEIWDIWSCSVRVYDGINYSSYMNSNDLLIRDDQAPNITIIKPANNTLTNISNVNFTMNASDAAGLANATLSIYNQTGLYNRTTINLGGVTQATVSVIVWLADGVYNWFWEVVDLFNNIATTQTNYGNYTITEDTIAPRFSNSVAAPSSPATYAPGQNYRFNITWTDERALDRVRIRFNGTTYMLPSAGNGVYSFTTNDLGAGSYNYQWFANDTAGNSNQTTVLTYVVSPASTSVFVIATPTSPITYGIASNFSCNSGGFPVNLYIDGNNANSQKGLEIVRRAGTYLVNCTIPSSANYSGSSAQVSYLINQASPVSNYYLNGLTANLTVTYPQQVNASGDTDVGTLAIYRDGASVNNGQNYTLASNYYRFDYNVTGNENYSNVSRTLYANITKALPVLGLTILPSDSVTVGTATTATGSGCPSELTCTLYRSDVAVLNPDIASLGIGSYTYVYNTTGNENYTFASVSAPLTVNPAGGGGGGHCTDHVWTPDQSTVCVGTAVVQTSNCERTRTVFGTDEGTWVCGEWSNCTNAGQERECASTCGLNRTDTRTCTCSPGWSCTGWSLCTKGQKTRTCTDVNDCGTNAGKPDEAIDCGKCKAHYHCGNWSDCAYDNNANEFVAGIMNYAGTRARECFDTNPEYCSENYTEYMNCTSGIEVETQSGGICNDRFLVIVNKNTKTPISTISLGSWQTSKLDVSFLQSKVRYCAWCYDGMKDYDETGIDCGGSCRACRPESKWPWGLINGILILLALLLLIPILKMSREDDDLLEQILALIKSGEESLKNKDRKNAENVFRKTKWIYIQMENRAKKKIALKAIQNYYKKIKTFTGF